MNRPDDHPDPRDAAADLMQRLIARGVRLERDGHRLTFDAPLGVVTADDLDALRRHKRDVLHIVRQLEAFDAPPTRPRPSRRDARPPMRPARPPRPDADARGALLDAARRAGFPRLPIPGRPAEAVAGGVCLVDVVARTLDRPPHTRPGCGRVDEVCQSGYGMAS